MNTEFENEIMLKARELETAIAPQRDLWPEIKASINSNGQAPNNDAAPSAATDRPPRRGGYRFYLAQAAVVVLLVGASSGITYKLTKTEPTISQIVTGVELVAEQASFGREFQLGADYGLAHSAVESQLNDMLLHLSPESRADVAGNLKVIRDAIAEMNAALEREPDNALLQGLLLETYREELAVMQKVGGLTRNVMSRNDI